MRAFEDEFGERVVELHGDHLRDVRLAALVFRVTSLALAGAGVAHPPVIVGMATQILRDILMTVHAQRGLRHLVGAVVAVAAVALLLDVRIAELAGH